MAASGMSGSTSLSSADGEFLESYMSALFGDGVAQTGSRASTASLPGRHRAASQRIEVIREIQKDTEYVTRIRQSLQQSDELTERMGHILSSFEERLQGLERVMLPIHKTTQNLTRMHDNIESTLVRINHVMDMVRVVADSEQRVMSPRGEIQEYCETVDRLGEALEFFAVNRSFKVAEKTTTRLKSLMSKAMDNVSEQVVYWLEKYATPLDPHKLPSPLPEELELLPEQEIKWLGELSAQLHAQGHSSYLKTYKETRSRFLSQTLFKMSPREVSGEETERIESYARGSHMLLPFTRLFVTLLRSERAVALRLIDQSLFDTVFSDTVEESVNLFVETCRGVIRRRRAKQDRMSTVLALYDILDTFRQQWPALCAALATKSKDQHIMEEVQGVLRSVEEACSCSFGEVIEAIRAHGVKQVAADGTVHELNAETIVYAKQLIEYQDVIAGLLPEPYKKVDELVAAVLEALRVNLETKSQSYKDPTLSVVFLLNNFHYVLKSVRRSSLVSIVPSQFLSDLERLIKRQREEITRTAWSGVLGHLLEKNRGLTERIHSLKPGHSPSKSDREAIKAKFAGFNAEFEGLRRKQEKYIIPDSDLRGQVRQDTLELLVPLYKAMWDRYSSLNFSRNRTKYVKHPVEEFEKLLSSFWK